MAFFERLLSASSFFSRLQPASLGGVPFGVLGANSRFGRRLAVHQYPFRDTPWSEDIGKSARRFQITGFLVENDAITGGRDVISQRDSLIAVVEAPGPLSLVHPTLGQMSVSVLEAAFTEKWDAGRYFEVDFSFIEAGQRIFPTANVNTGNAVGSSATSADSAASSDFSTAATTIST